VRGVAANGGGRQRWDPGRIWRAAGGADGVSVSRPGLCVTLKRLGLPRKKRTLRASEQAGADVAAERAAFAERVKSIASEDLVFVDETFPSGEGRLAVGGVRMRDAGLELELAIAQDRCLTRLSSCWGA
jgi:hypothetical protein